MKLVFDSEDAIIGVVMGLLVLGLSGRYYKLELNKWVYIIGFAAFAVFIVLDVINEWVQFESHPITIGILMLHNFVALVISAAFFSKFAEYSIPFITENLVPYLSDPVILFYAGMFMVVTDGLWLATFPFHSI